MSQVCSNKLSPYVGAAVVASSFAAGWYCRRSLSDATRLPRFAPSTADQQHQKTCGCCSESGACTLPLAAAALKRQVREKWRALFPSCSSSSAAAGSQCTLRTVEDDAEVGGGPPAATGSSSAAAGSAQPAAGEACPSAVATAVGRKEARCGVPSVAAASLQADGFPGQRRQQYKNLVITRRLVVPYEEVRLFAPVLNDLAALNTRQSGFLSQTVYVRELAAAAPPASPTTARRAAERAVAAATVEAATADSGGEAARGAGGDKEGQYMKHKALEILSVEEWVDPVAAREAMACPARKNLLESARRKGWDLTGEIWMGVGERGPEPYRSKGDATRVAEDSRGVLKQQM